MAGMIEREGLPYRPCVGVMVLNAEGLIFSGQRIDSTVEAWQMPQGGIDPGEEPLTAALRELGEETGIPAGDVTLLRESDAWIPYDLPDALLGKIWKGRYRGQTQRWFAFRLTGPDSLIDIQTEEPEFKTWAWMTPETLIESIVPFKRATYERVFGEFGDLIGTPA